jgi:hypothetical protein
MIPSCLYCGEDLETPCEPCPECHKYVCIECDLRGPECRPCQDGLFSDSSESSDDPSEDRYERDSDSETEYE